ncbi:MAG: helix-turn-helix domain-containing protein [Cyanobium sp. M30B3]|nr:MAG: helix-turn-helix domain-containing protein [Cyanobium sp. M30B3]
MSAEPIPELQRLGQRLAQARQARGLSLEQQADRLHMGPEQLRALEEGNRKELPEAVFVVAQARRVAASLGLNIDDDIAALRRNQAFQARQPMPQPSSGPSAAPARRPAAQPDAPPPAPPSRPPLRLLGLGAALLAAGGLAWGLQRSLTGARPSPDVQPPTAVTASPAGRPQAELVLRSAEPSWVEVRSASGEVLLRGTLQGEQRFPLSGELRVLAGRPDLVSAASGGAPARPLGRIEAVTWYRFSPQVSPAVQPAPAP